jgi:hypothetical protein
VLQSQDEKQTVTAPNIRPQMLVLAAQEAKDDVDRVFNETEPFILQNSSEFRFVVYCRIP